MTTPKHAPDDVRPRRLRRADERANEDWLADLESKGWTRHITKRGRHGYSTEMTPVVAHRNHLWGDPRPAVDVSVDSRRTLAFWRRYEEQVTADTEADGGALAGTLDVHGAHCGCATCWGLATLTGPSATHRKDPQ